MPELPEVERVRMMLEASIVGRTIERVRIIRRDVIATPRDPAGGFARNRSERSAKRDATPSRVMSADLLAGTRVERIVRRGKRMAIIGANGRALDVHLGMTGSVVVMPAKGALPDHAHIVWTVGRHQASGTRHQSEGDTPHLSAPPHKTPTSSPPRGEAGEPETARMIFRDPRRFGGVWTCGSVEDLRARRWGGLGPDALTIDGAMLADRVRGSKRAIKAALLDQSVVAGVGNIYADESLFDARVHPEAPADGLTGAQLECLAAAVRDVMRRSIHAGGSTIRDFAMPDGSPGSYQENHAVYGRAGEPCWRCSGALVGVTVAQRTTTFCPRCQGIGPHSVPTGTGHARVRKSHPLRKSSL